MLSYFRSPIYLSPFFACPITFIALLSYFLLAPVSESLAVLLVFLVLSSALSHLASTAFRIFKRALLNEFLRRRLTSLAEFFCLFPPLSLFPNKTDRKWTFHIAFINSRLLTGNHT